MYDERIMYDGTKLSLIFEKLVTQVEDELVLNKEEEIANRAKAFALSISTEDHNDKSFTESAIRFAKEVIGRPLINLLYDEIQTPGHYFYRDKSDRVLKELIQNVVTTTAQKV